MGSDCPVQSEANPNPPPRLAVVDDEEGLLFLMADTLRRSGYQVDGFSSGKDAQEWLSSHTASLLVLDLKLTDLPALLLVERLRQAGREFPFIIVTGHGDERTAVDVMKQGALDYVMKDSGMLELLPSVVRRAITVVEREKKLIEANEAIRDREERHKHVIQTALDGFMRFDRTGRILEVNSALCGLLDFGPEELLNMNVLAGGSVTFNPDVCELIARRDGGGAVHCFTQLSRRDGSQVEVELSLRDGHGEIFGFVHNISEQRRLEREVLDVNLEERRQFGRELHDGLGQQLTALEMMSHTLARQLESSPNQAKFAWEITKYIRQTITQTRELAHGLAPVAAEGEGLMRALHDLAEMTTTAGTPCEFKCEQPVTLEDSAAAGNLYRIAQEAVTNALKHGKPTRIWMQLVHRGPHTELTIEDDGAGLPPAGNTGMGLQVMQHRARLIGGHVVVASAPEHGVRVVCSIPRLT